MGFREEIEDARGAVTNYGGITDTMSFAPRASLGERMLYVMDLTINPVRRVKELLQKAVNELQQNGLPVRGLWLCDAGVPYVIADLAPPDHPHRRYELLVTVPPGGVTEKQDELVKQVVKSWIPFLSVDRFVYGCPPDDTGKFNFAVAGVGPKEWRL